MKISRYWALKKNKKIKDVWLTKSESLFMRYFWKRFYMNSLISPSFSVKTIKVKL